MTLPLLRRTHRPATPIPVAPITVPSAHYGVEALTAQLDQAQARADAVAAQLAAARAELAVRPAGDPLLVRLAVEGPACTEVLAAELELTPGEVAARMGRAVAAGVCGCIDHADGVIWCALDRDVA